MRRTAVVLIGVVALVVGLTGSASASPAERTIRNYNNIAQKAVYFYDNVTGTEPADAGYARWTRQGTDSPLDRFDRALHISVPAATPDGSYFAVFSTPRSEDQDRAVWDVRNLSWDLRTNASDGGGAPRISVEFLNGDVAYLASNTCRRTLAVDSRWSRADFTGLRKAYDATTGEGCGFYVSGATGGFYSSDGVNSAWTNYADANPNQRVTATYMVLDNPGNYWVDHIALGTNWSYTSGLRRGVYCASDESRC